MKTHKNNTPKTVPTSPANNPVSASVPAQVTATNGTLRILIVDDHAIVRDGLFQLLSDAFPSAFIAVGCHARDALEHVTKQKWDVLLLDISMPGQSGLDALTQLLVIQPDLKVLVLTMHAEDQYGVRVLKAGAAGYLTKETVTQQVVAAVQKVLAGGTYISPALAESLANRLGVSQTRASHEALSDREYQIMRLIAAGKSVKEIGFDLSLSIKTISTYRARLLKKLNLKSNADIIMYAVREKLIE
jgi:two-component system invasion response regulator UvrY